MNVELQAPRNHLYEEKTGLSLILAIQNEILPTALSMSMITATPSLPDRQSGPRLSDRSWADAVGSDAVFTLLQGNAAHEGMNERLCAAIGRIVRLADFAELRTGR
ncbi:hypothetical protein EV128_102326 [Rhizobium azibense]|nr:hypothetical protein EV128_102326 [Rhizobium azibense]